MPLRLILAGATLWLIVLPVWAANERIKEITVDDGQVAVWNRFVDRIYELHRRQIAGREIRQTQVTGEYGGTATRGYPYIETSYYDARTDLLLSRVRTDRNRPESLQIIEVFVHDSRGRIMRDFAAIFLPWAHNAPIRTMINLHQYNDTLHAFRQFDASGERVYEQCKGTYAGRKVDLSLEPQDVDSQVAASAVYRACFAGMYEKAGAYLTPH